MLYAAPAITIYSCFIAALLGACMGSFLNCAAWRVVHGESVLRGRSHCDVCGHVLAPRDLVPVFSYVFSHGRCRYCGAKLSPRHAVGEAVAALVFVSLLLRYDISLRTLEAWAVACLLLACAFADLEGYIIPDRFIVVGVVLFIVTLFFVPDPGKRALDGLIGGVAVGGAADGEAAPPRRYGRRRYQAAVSRRAVSGLAEKPAVPAAGLRRRHPMGPCPRQARTAGPSLGPRHRAGRLERRPVRPEPYRLVSFPAVSPHLQESEVFCFEEDRWH